MNPSLSETVKALIARARIVSFANWQDSHPVAAIGLFQAADDQGRYLTDADLQQVQALAPAASSLIPVAQMLRDRASEIVSEARAEVLAAYPNILEPGGGLHPPERAEACWRDFWHFLRCISYGIAGHQVQYTSSEGLHAMQLLYEALDVPLNAMILGLEHVKIASLQRVESSQQEILAPYFDQLITQLNRFTHQQSPQLA